MTTAAFDSGRATDTVIFAQGAGRTADVTPVGNQITDEEFAALDWPAQNKVLRDLNNLSCAQDGRTYSEAQRKRAPIDKRMQELQAIHDKQVRDWIMEASPTKPNAQDEMEQLQDDEPGDETEHEIPAMQ